MLPALILFIGMVCLQPSRFRPLAHAIHSFSSRSRPGWSETKKKKHKQTPPADALCPRWLVAQGREEEAYGVLQKLHFNGENKEWLDGEFAEICEVSNH